MITEILRETAHFIMDSVFYGSILCLLIVVLLLLVDKVSDKWKDYYIWGAFVLVWGVVVLLLKQ